MKTYAIAGVIMLGLKALIGIGAFEFEPDT